MVEFGDELVLQSLRIPWLIWIQLLVMFLLLLLLYSLTSPSDASSSSSCPSSSAAADAPSTSSSPPPLDSRKQFLPARGAHQLQVEESQGVKGFVATSASRRVAVEEDAMEGENSSHGYMDHHPCSIVRLARIVFLKCLGLDFTSENSSFKRRRR